MMKQSKLLRFGLTIILIAVIATVNAQTLMDIEKRLRLLDKAIPVSYDTAGFSTLPKVKYDCNDHFEAYDVPENKAITNYYHVVDLNNDGLKDLIYSGPCMPYDQTAVFLNDGHTVRLVHDYPGQLISIEKLADRTTINILKRFCCCDYYSDYIQVTVNNDSSVDKNIISFEGNTEVKFDKLTELEVKGTLRTTPELKDEDDKDPCTDREIKGNHLAYITKPTKVVQLRQSGKWKLVLYPVDKMNSWIGWIWAN